ncbi:hypothetical protein OT109_04075 [Phycisphaeraceae bacterium D3-23]
MESEHADRTPNPIDHLMLVTWEDSDEDVVSALCWATGFDRDTIREAVADAQGKLLIVVPRFESLMKMSEELYDSKIDIKRYHPKTPDWPGAVWDGRYKL